MARPDAWHGAYVEPGIYIPRDDSTAEIAQAYRGMGIRIEDAVLIQKQGCQVLTEGLIKEPDDIEAWMAARAEKEYSAGGGVSIGSLQPCSVAVAGGGPVGAAAALSLADRGYAVTLVDQHRPQPGPSAFGMDIRNVALSPRSAELLKQIDSWPEQAAAYEKMCVWEERGTSRLTFDAAGAGRGELGWLLRLPRC